VEAAKVKRRLSVNIDEQSDDDIRVPIYGHRRLPAEAFEMQSCDMPVLGLSLIVYSWIGLLATFKVVLMISARQLT